MKKLIKISVVAVLISIMTVFTFAFEEGDYGYYDVTDDGKIEIVDVLCVIKQVVNDKPDNGGLLRVIRALKLVTESKVITPIITEIDTENQTVTLLLGSADEKDFFTVPMQKIGFDKNYLLDFYLDGTVTMTVSGDFETSKDTSLVHAAKAFSKYDINEIHLTADSTTATLNGEEHTLYTPPIMQDGVLMVSADFLAEKLEVIASWNNTTMSANFNDDETELEMMLDSITATLNGETVTLDAPMTTVGMHTYVPAAFFAEAFGAAATFYEDTSTLVIVKQFLPILTVTNVTGAAGEEVSVTVSLLHNPGIAGLEIELVYDSSVLSYVSASTVSNGMYANASTEVGANPVKFVTAHLGLENVEGDLTFFTANFKIADDAPAGRYDFSCENIKLCDANIYALKVKVKPCGIKVIE